jgi:membrane fusion protein, multidrug efflux system
MANMETPRGQKPEDPAKLSNAPEQARVHKPKNRGGWLLGIFLAIVLVVPTIYWIKQRSAQRGRTPAVGRGQGSFGPVPVVAGNVIQKDVPIYLDGLGTVQAFNTVTIRPRVDGQIIKIAFNEGKDVRAGDLLAQIDPAPFQTQLDQNIAKKAQDEAQLAVARTTLQRNTTLLADKILSQQDYDTQKAMVDQLVATVQADEAAINSAKVQLSYATITSPLDGRTGIRQVDVGNIVHATGDSNALVVITQLRPISVVFTLPEQNMRQIQEQLREGVELSTLAMDRDNRTLLDEGKLAVIDNQIDTTTGTLRLKATFPNVNLHLWPGQFVNVRLLVQIRKNGTVVPASVVQRGPEGPYAFVINNEKAEVRPIQVARIEQGEALIDSGLQPGEKVVVDGQYKLQAGSQVKISSPAPATQPAQNQSRPAPASGGDAAP